MAASLRAVRSNLARRSMTAAMRIRDGRPGKCGVTREHFVEHAAERPDVGAFVDRLAARLFRRHVGGSAEDDAGLCHGRGCDRRDCSLRPTRPLALSGASAFARPKSSTFTVPSDRDLDVRRLQIAVNDPGSCAASSASAICFAIRRASSSGKGTTARCDRRASAPRPAP